ncbi:alpha/beta fold hydrolase (plasmid) [Burkholderia gladioli]|uniref:thioesterase domain-containing protein n=1 Tax=Burkholderia gladioli TaxID=28095 RepID=UPI001938EB8B|nr:alpha/beta fold hydrolase [Burkholderia gladioli]QPQ89124.1 alpha/beta fold hydrolase [Burkholderia gladioli]
MREFNDGPIKCKPATLLRPGRSKNSLFVPVGSHPQPEILALALDLDVEYSVYALPLPGLFHSQSHSIEALAAMAVFQIKEVKPDGPYCLIGYSAYSVIAYAIAQHLLEIDSTVSFLALIDADLPSCDQGSEDIQLTKPQNQRGDLAVSRTVDGKSLLEKLQPRTLPFTVHHLTVNNEKLDVTDALTTPQKEAVRSAASTTRFRLSVHSLLSKFTKNQRIHLADDPSVGVVSSMNAADLGQHLSRALAHAHLEHIGRTSEFSPLLPLKIVRTGNAPLFCIPGAGGSITSFMEFVSALDDCRSVYGLQPRGLDRLHPPHGSVEAAAAYFLRALHINRLNGPIHLLGHSHGGLVAFEMARRLSLDGFSILSLTVLDSSSPAQHKDEVVDMTWPDIFIEYLSALNRTLDLEIKIDENTIEQGDIEMFLFSVHGQLVKKGAMPVRSHFRTLEGPLRAYAAARRTSYHPQTVYCGNMTYVTFPDASQNKKESTQSRFTCKKSWSKWTANFEVWDGPGDHYSVLKAPHASILAAWWESRNKL